MPAPIVLPEGLSDDPDIYEAVKNLALRGIEAATDILDTGSGPMRLQMIRLLLPRVTGALSRGSEDEDAELRAQVAQMYDRVNAAFADPDTDQ